MKVPSHRPREAEARDLLYMATPALWPAWPYLPLIRHRPDGEYDCGLLFDANAAGLPDHSTTVFLCNLLMVPGTLEEFLALPREEFDTPQQIAAAGWLVD